SAEPRENSFRGRSLFPRARRGQQRHRNGDEEGRPEKRGLLPTFKEQGRPVRRSSGTCTRRDGKRHGGSGKVSSRGSGSASHHRALSKCGPRKFAGNWLRARRPWAGTRAETGSGTQKD